MRYLAAFGHLLPTTFNIKLDRPFGIWNFFFLEIKEKIGALNESFFGGCQVPLFLEFLCTFLVVFLQGLVTLSFSTQFLLIKPHGCGITEKLCDHRGQSEFAIFYVSVYLIALGNGAPEPALATFGADQFDEEDAKEKQSKSSFYSYFYVALNLGSLVSETVVVYINHVGNWVLGFWLCAGSAVVAFVLLLCGTLRYRHFKTSSGNPFSRFCQVIVASFRKMHLELPSNTEGLYEDHEIEDENCGMRKIVHTNDFKYVVFVHSLAKFFG